MMSHAVGGFVALNNDERNSAIHDVETTLHAEFNIVLGITRDVYYEDDRTPERPTTFDGDNEFFGKVIIDIERSKPRQSSRKLRA